MILPGQQLPMLQVRRDLVGQIQKQLHAFVLVLHASPRILRALKIQTIVQRERDHTRNEPQKPDVFVSEWPPFDAASLRAGL